jgi:hypothetical protein
MLNDRQVGIEPDHLECNTQSNGRATAGLTRGEMIMVRIRHCLECPTCGLRYVISLNPYRNGSRIITAVSNGQEEYLLYCACRRGASRWIESDVLLCDVSTVAFDRGYGTPTEIWCPRARRGIAGSSDDASASTTEIG